MIDVSSINVGARRVA